MFDVAEENYVDPMSVFASCVNCSTPDRLWHEDGLYPGRKNVLVEHVMHTSPLHGTTIGGFLSQHGLLSQLMKLETMFGLLRCFCGVVPSDSLLGSRLISSYTSALTRLSGSLHCSQIWVRV